MAEWLRSGLQIRIPRFDSGRGLQPPFPTFETQGVSSQIPHLASVPGLRTKSGRKRARGCLWHRSPSMVATTSDALRDPPPSSDHCRFPKCALTHSGTSLPMIPLNQFRCRPSFPSEDTAARRQAVQRREEQKREAVVAPKPRVCGKGPSIQGDAKPAGKYPAKRPCRATFGS